MGATVENNVIALVLTVILIFLEVAHCPISGVKV
jgi:hypothetical protein